MGDIKGLSVDNWQGAGGTPSTGGGTAEGGLQGPLAAQPCTVFECYFGEQ